MLSKIFGFRRKAAGVADRPSTALARDLGVAREESGLLLEALGSVLQLYGRHAFDIGSCNAEDVRTRVAAWARHATVGSPRPGREEQDSRGVRLLDRDWKGLVHAFAQLRNEERQGVLTSRDDLRSVVDAFVGAVFGLTADGDDTERATTDVLQRVKQATVSNDTEQLKREALVAVDKINTLMVKRRQRQQERVASLGQEVRTLCAELEVAKHESQIDPLTGLANRKAFDAQLKRSIELNALLRTPACLMLVDVDYFKSVNDDFGHPAGDAVLKGLAEAHARTFLRRSDLVSRFGGDEFGIILGDTPGPGAEKLADRLRQAAQNLHRAVPGMKESPTLSIGIAELVAGDDPTSWVERADRALYAAKKGGRDRIRLAPTDAPSILSARSARRGPVAVA